MWAARGLPDNVQTQPGGVYVYFASFVIVVREVGAYDAFRAFTGQGDFSGHYQPAIDIPFSHKFGYTSERGYRKL
jgi:hypothetical protein